VLEQVAERTGATVVLLGHTLDDQAETVLLGLTRGSGGRSVAGMRRAFGRFRRPLLGLRRSQTEAACEAEGIAFWSDPHNEDPRYTRSRVRQRVMPVLEESLGPGVAETLARTGELLREDMELLDDLAEDLLRNAAAPEGLRLDVLTGRADALVGRVLRRAALAAGCPGAELFRVHVLALSDRAFGQPGGRQALEAACVGDVAEPHLEHHLAGRACTRAGAAVEDVGAVAVELVDLGVERVRLHVDVAGVRKVPGGELLGRAHVDDDRTVLDELLGLAGGDGADTLLGRGPRARAPGQGESGEQEDGNGADHRLHTP